MTRNMRLTAYDEFGNELNEISIGVTEAQWNAMNEDEKSEIEKSTLAKLFRVRVSPFLDSNKINEYKMKDMIFDYCKGEGVDLNEGIRQIIDLLKIQI
ncbi:TPA: hypothetical protein ACKRFF_001198 [Providencia stuartii]|uniref:hypothetical protein n=1 Tax=Providencia TaxID=586 RepID=UPI00197F743B|nr:MULTISPECIES: hypothetical protein [Providencia]MBN5557246.1 hypothetical protein [Providencia stuartii]HEM8264043.1 hypothetical protein [Providencia stuartii]HEM8284061.1 hypothetical protein [Providencia stuartii]